MNDVLIRLQEYISNLLYQYQYPTTTDLNFVVLAVLGILFCFGLMNVLLGFRLMRFWMILASITVGLIAGAFLTYRFDIQLWIALLCGGVTGIALALLSFFVYNWGLFVIGTAIGGFAAIYFVAPRSSLTFFLCILFGVLLGILAMKISKPILILGTSVVGGILSGFTLAWLGRLFQPGPLGVDYTVWFSLGFAFLGILIQSVTNRIPQEVKEVTPLVDEVELLEGEGRVRRDDFGRKYLE